jgi:hypothetical protein
MSGQDAIELTYLPDRDVLAAAQRAINRSFKFTTGRPTLDFAIEVAIGVVIAFVAGLATYALVQVSGLTSKPFKFTVWASITLVSLYYFRRALVRWYQRRIYSLKEFNDQLRVVLDAQGIVIETETMDTRIKWAGIQELVPLKSGLGLQCGATMIAIPAHAISADLGVNGLIARISEWKDAAQ